MTINKETLRSYRDSKGFSQAELAERSRVSKKTISRIELGEIDRPNQATRKRLANALGVDVLDLAKPAGEREAIERRLRNAGYRKIGTYIDSNTAVAYAMVQHRYGVSLQTLIDMAPLLLTLYAEGSLEWRKKKVAELRTAIEVLGSVSKDTPHLAYAAAGYRADEGLADEDQSIANRDIFGKDISEEAWSFGFNSLDNNPFVDYLRLLCRDIDASALEIDPYGEGNWNADNCMPDYLIAPAEFEAITGGDPWVEFAIKRGHVRISEIPADLMGKEREAERVAWIASKIPDEARKKHQDRLDEIKIKFGNAEVEND